MPGIYHIQKLCETSSGFQVRSDGGLGALFRCHLSLEISGKQVEPARTTKSDVQFCSRMRNSRMHKSHKTLGALICHDLSASSWRKFQAATACSGKHCVQIIGRLDRNGAGNILMQKTPTCTENQCKLKHAFFRHWAYGQESGRSQVIPAPMDPDPQTSHGLTEWLQFQWAASSSTSGAPESTNLIFIIGIHQSCRKPVACRMPTFFVVAW